METLELLAPIQVTPIATVNGYAVEVVRPRSKGAWTWHLNIIHTTNGWIMLYSNQSRDGGWVPSMRMHEFRSHPCPSTQGGLETWAHWFFEGRL